jgi:hypothetical protein
MKKAEFVRVSCLQQQDFSMKNVEGENRGGAGGRVDALGANSRDSMKQALNAVVEVHYTTVMLEVAR